MRIGLLDVGHGSSAVFHSTTSGRAVVVDCPPGHALPSYLRREQLSVIDHLFISHGDKDHCGGVAALLASGIRIRKLWINDDHYNDTRAFRAVGEVYSTARAAGTIIRRGYPHSDEDDVLWDDFRFQILTPRHERRLLAMDRNRSSVVLRVAYGEEARGVVLLPGDIDQAGFHDVADFLPDITCKWLVAPHHGGLAGTDRATAEFMQELMEVTDADSVFFSFGRASSQTRPRARIMSVIQGAKKPTQVRCSQLSLQCAEVHPLPSTTAGFQDLTSAGMLRGTPTSCAGTVILDSENDFEWSLGMSHDAFKAAVTDPERVPLCRAQPPTVAAAP